MSDAQSISVDNVWQKNLAQLIDHTAMHSFPSQLIDYLSTLCHFDNSLIVTFKEAFRPLVIHPLDPAEQSQTLLTYLDHGYYLLDPLFNAINNGVPSGVVRVGDITPDSFQNSEFYQNCYRFFDIVDETALIIRLDAKITAAVSLNRKHALGAITRSEYRALQEMFPIIAALFRQFWSCRAGDYLRFEQSDDALKRALDSFGSGVLTQRERQVTAMVLRGNSSQAIAQTLNISLGTVKVHRKNIHAKLQTGTQSELFNRFLSHLKTQLNPQQSDNETLSRLQQLR